MGRTLTFRIPGARYGNFHLRILAVLRDQEDECERLAGTLYTKGLPTSILEAMANKTPFAMMEGNGGLKDIADLNRTKGPIGVIVPKGDIEAHATGL